MHVLAYCRLSKKIASTYLHRMACNNVFGRDQLLALRVKVDALWRRYGGPGSQKVTERFQLGWETYLASSEKVVYASLDGRGTSSRGNRFKFLLYRNLGSIEIEDQLLAGLWVPTSDHITHLISSKLNRTRSTAERFSRFCTHRSPVYMQAHRPYTL